MHPNTILTIVISAAALLICSCQQYKPVIWGGHEVATPMSETR